MTNETRPADEESVLLPPDGGGGKRLPRREFFGALFLMAIASAFIIQALRMPFKDPSWEWYTAPNIFPLAMAACLAFCALFVGMRGFAGWRRDHDRIRPIRWVEDARAWGMGRFVAATLMIALLVYLLGKVNFYLLAPASIVVFGLAFRSDPLPKTLKSAVIAAAFVAAFLYMISRIFGIVFP
jgi:hypothetical protein